MSSEFQFIVPFTDCGPLRQPRDQSEYENILRRHSDVFATGKMMLNLHINTSISLSTIIAKADIEFTFPVESAEEEELRLIFNWRPKFMSRIKDYADLDSFDTDHDFVNDTDKERSELLMFALPHHQERMRPISGSSNIVLDPGCMPTIHGVACPVRFYYCFWLSYEHHSISLSLSLSFNPYLSVYLPRISAERD